MNRLLGATANFMHSAASRKLAVLVNPPVYDTQYWAEWSQPYGLLRIGAWLKKRGYKRVELFDFLETNEKREVHQHRINPDESYTQRDSAGTRIQPIIIGKDGESLELFKYHFGKTWQEFEKWLDDREFTGQKPPDEIYISAIMTYWWESVRDLIARLRRRFGSRTTILLGGVYPTLVPEHAAQMCQPDIVVEGEIPEANDLWTDLSLYERPPQYAVITPSRGCPYNCAYCAQRALNGGSRRVRHRNPNDIVDEMKHKYDTFGIRDFAFYADSLLSGFRENFMRVLERLVRENLPFRLYAPEGLDTRPLSSSQKLVDLLKAAHLQKVYLPLETVDQQMARRLGRNHTSLETFVKAVTMCERAGFRLRNMAVNAFVLYGLPRERIDDAVRTIVFASEVAGSVIPMLFAPVPGSGLYREHFAYISQRGWHLDLHMLNGKLFPFLEMNEGTVADYIDLQRLMYMLNAHYRSKSFQLFGPTNVAASFRKHLNDGFANEIVRNFAKHITTCPPLSPPNPQ